jgi:hypothetical protein
LKTASKILPKWSGPYSIVETFDHQPNVVIVASMENLGTPSPKTEIINVARITKFTGWGGAHHSTKMAKKYNARCLRGDGTTSPGHGRNGSGSRKRIHSRGAGHKVDSERSPSESLGPTERIHNKY